MYNVMITYTNGEGHQFPAQEFDVDFDTHNVEASARLQKLTYKVADGNDTFVYLTPALISGIVLVPR